MWSSAQTHETGIVFRRKSFPVKAWGSSADIATPTDQVRKLRFCVELKPGSSAS